MPDQPHPEGTPDQPTPAGPTAEQPAEAHAAGAEPPPAAPPAADHPTPPRRGAAVGRFARHRATQLVAVGLLGLVLGGGFVALLDHDRGHDRRGAGFDRPGHSRLDDRGHGREFRDFRDR
ncbi:hypothetical protein [Saccharothrix variisporea]|uniref:Uncharacterized protein n=1 Tax=Saccharothrix variisporea TaxID=543527 RepID=A0A495X4K2_9PSEU|nr:hypothetical protein [Saccharothrix variisporea]RKT68449.1 hypothetical protein DFJ66_1634 [Saccharothrix variisporea]